MEIEWKDYDKECARLGWRKEFGWWGKDGQTQRYGTAKECYDAEFAKVQAAKVSAAVNDELVKVQAVKVQAATAPAVKAPPMPERRMKRGRK